MKSLPLVSILTPTYNRRPFIAQYLRYIRGQDYRGPIEILIADDDHGRGGNLLQPVGDIDARNGMAAADVAWHRGVADHRRHGFDDLGMRRAEPCGEPA